MSTPVTLDFNDIQGDILQGLPKKYETFVFFVITDSTAFRLRFNAIIPLITTTAQVLADEAAIAAHKSKGVGGLLKLVGTNVAFSASGLSTLGIPNDIGNATDVFVSGQLKDAVDTTNGLSDPLSAPGVPDWDSEFKQTIHGCFLITGESRITIDLRKVELEAILIETISVIASLDGAVRPGVEAGHEPFGYKDGLSQPPVTGFRNPNPGEDAVDAGIIIVGEAGDPSLATRPPWAKNGSFLVFRKLKQLVPEFNKFLNDNPIPDPSLTPEQGSALLGARFVGRWKSGAPIDRDPTQDNLADTTPDKVNDFDYSDDPTETRCPFAAHLRKMNPRASVPGGGGEVNVRHRRIIRQGIPYGPEVSDDEASSGTTKVDRGLLFVCYQSSINNQFHFLQRSWANNQNFPALNLGEDPIIGQTAVGTRTMSGSDPQNTSTSMSLPVWVMPRGGEYFLAPSISALKGTIAST